MRSDSSTTTRPVASTVTEVDEMALWRAFKSGDQAAFARMYQCYSRVLYGYGFRVTHDAALIEDCIQDLFIELWRTRENLSDTTSIKFYLFRSLRRRISRTINADPQRTEISELADHVDHCIQAQRREQVVDPGAPNTDVFGLPITNVYAHRGAGQHHETGETNACHAVTHGRSVIAQEHQRNNGQNQ